MNESSHYYQQHIFFCVNQKEGGRKCCYEADAERLWAYAKERLQALGYDKQQVRVNKAGCLGRCSEGPAIVIYPEGIWYTYQSEADIDEIIEQQLIQGKLVKRLLMKQ
jgi:(2Fe-2S) ferredoxin